MAESGSGNQLLREVHRHLDCRVAGSDDKRQPILYKLALFSVCLSIVVVQHGHHLDIAHQTLRHQPPYPPRRSVAASHPGLQALTQRLVVLVGVCDELQE